MQQSAVFGNYIVITSKLGMTPEQQQSLFQYCVMFKDDIDINDENDIKTLLALTGVPDTDEFLKRTLNDDDADLKAAMNFTVPGLLHGRGPHTYLEILQTGLATALAFVGDVIHSHPYITTAVVVTANERETIVALLD